MPRTKVQPSLRTLVTGSLTGALVVSLLIHVALIAALELGRQLGWWHQSVLTALVSDRIFEEVVKTAEERAEKERQVQQQQPPPEAELVFVDVDPSQAIPEPPPDAKYYSSQSTAAANRTQDEPSNVPKIEGTQENVAKTTETVRPTPKPPEQTPPPAEKEPPKTQAPQPTPKPEVQPTPKIEPTPAVPRQEAVPEKGETLLAKVLPREQPQPANNPPPAEQPRRRPRTLAEAQAEHGIVVGPKLRQKGGARIANIEGLDVKASPFGAYDALFIEAVQARWFSILDERNFVGNQSGKVVVEFRLHSNGRITDLRVDDATVNELLSWFCQRAILDPSPYRPFPEDLRRLMSNDYREIRFTFYYNQ